MAGNKLYRLNGTSSKEEPTLLFKENTSQLRQIQPRFRYQDRQPDNEIQRLDKIAWSDFERPQADPKGAGQDARSKLMYVVPLR